MKKLTALMLSSYASQPYLALNMLCKLVAICVDPAYPVWGSAARLAGQKDRSGHEHHSSVHQSLQVPSDSQQQGCTCLELMGTGQMQQ